jgi:hypothetical protein
VNAAREPIAKPKPRRGRPPMLTTELRSEWVRLVAGGLMPIEAARELGIPERTAQNWGRPSPPSNRGGSSRLR